MAPRGNFYVKVPKSAYPVLEEMISLSDEEFQGLADALRATAPSLPIENFAIAAASRLDRSPEGVEGIVDMLAGILYVQDVERMSPEETTSDVIANLRGSSFFDSKSDDAEEKLRGRLETLLNMEESMGIVAKASQLWAERERLFRSAKIVTDIRPVFVTDAESDVTNAIIIHTLSIDYIEGRNLQTILLALDAENIRTLQGILARAEAKARILTRFLGSMNVRLLEDS